ncbi:Site-specific recombinase XerD [Lentzea xinjiangensis]|uniref:Site-specific recombinase XerD n=1 Tax=Lentzea xinjiangensis TaxID=402600 RepID=A0A1H9TDD0_9PSEU|nr:tyrosine-type recombinase/integrase [Lentzea xinjiangensis]SER94819.1 Site-specific recombinase XerD [Lentzea xinjiangensis]
MPEQPTPHGWESLIREWVISLRAGRKSKRTIEVYERAALFLARWLADNDLDLAPDEIERQHVEQYFADLNERTSPGNAHTNYRSLRTMFRWMVDNEEIARSPMDKVAAPILDEKPVPTLSDDQIRALLDHWSGRDMVSRRNTAIIRLLMDTGCRLGEIANLTLDDVDRDLEVIRVLGKGNRVRAVPFGPSTNKAIGQYLRVREREPWAARTNKLWLAERNRGPLQPNGNAIKLMLRRTGHALGIDLADGKHVHAHRFRHTAAKEWRKNGGDVVSMKRIFGWKSDAMPERYGSAAADEIAQQHHRELGLGERL